MTWLTIVKALIVVVATIITAGTPAVIALKKAWNARKDAQAKAEAAQDEAEREKAEADKEKANADLLASAKSFIAAAETAFEGFDKMMKQQNGTAGPMKKDTVFTKLQAYALQNGYEFDAETWSTKIDELVAFTKSVNSKT